MSCFLLWFEAFSETLKNKIRTWKHKAWFTVTWEVTYKIEEQEEQVIMVPFTKWSRTKAWHLENQFHLYWGCSTDINLALLSYSHVIYSDKH